MNLEDADRHYRNCVHEWAEADAECRRYFKLYETAKNRRLQLYIAKNNAWGDLEMAKAEASALTSHERKMP